MTDDVLACYPEASGRAVSKEIDHVDRHVRRFLGLCPFVVLSSASTGGEPDLTPRGGTPGFVKVIDDHTVMLPDRPGNNRLDLLTTIAANPRVALLCFVPGIDETLRLYGTAELRHAEDAPVDATERGRAPRSVMVITVDKAFMHCAKALMRARLWDPDARVPRDAFPTISEVVGDHANQSGPLETQEAMRARYQPDL